MDIADNGATMLGWAHDLWPMPRSLTGDGVRQTIRYLSDLLPGLVAHEVPSGTPAGDWTVPAEWRVRDAYITAPDGRRIAQWRVNPLHLVGYSQPVSERMDLDTLQGHLHSLPDQPTAIPYVTSYYTPRWGFCLPHAERVQLRPGEYRAVIDAEFRAGSLTYADCVIPGRSDEEILFSTYICHSAMANNELSGIVVQTALARWLHARGTPWYTYRFVYAPETIGSLIYLERHREHLLTHVRAGWVLSCVGDERDYSLVPSRRPGNLGERLLTRSLAGLGRPLTRYTWRERGSDERQWCAPRVDLPMCTFSRSRFGTFPEYHTSLDDFTVVTDTGLMGSLTVMRECIRLLEEHPRYLSTTIGEPQLGRRGLYPTLSDHGGNRPMSGALSSARELLLVLSYCDGDADAAEIAELVGRQPTDVADDLATLERAGLIRRA
ncbi:MAG: DUF4910 domain-containing protein [Actinomycetales bacterium]|nr:DUF4910 domain-containing protein [Actinomycetales bacterium]